MVRYIQLQNTTTWSCDTGHVTITKVKRSAWKLAVRFNTSSTHCWKAGSPLHQPFNGLLGSWQSVTRVVYRTAWKLAVRYTVGTATYRVCDRVLNHKSECVLCEMVGVNITLVSYVCWCCFLFVDTPPHHTSMQWLIFDTCVRTLSQHVQNCEMLTML